MGKYDIGEIWWVHFPYQEEDIEKRRPAIVIDDETIAVLAMYVTSKDKNNPYSIEIEDWKESGLTRPSWTRIDRIISLNEWYMDRKIGKLSQKDLIKLVQLVAEITSGTFYEFSIVAVKNFEGRYLQKFDERWKCWLFPYIRSSENNKSNVDQYISELLKTTVTTTYISCTKHCKYSISDDVYKIYNHKLYEVSLTQEPLVMREKQFIIDDTKYSWMSIEEMEKDPDIMKKNDDVVSFVKRKCT